jgi:hypothetical protein
MRADEIDPLTDCLACEPHRLVVIARDELRVGGNAGKDRREWIADSNEAHGGRSGQPLQSDRNKIA